MNYFVIAGEASGDLHAANLIRSINAMDPSSRFTAMGGDLCRDAGATLLRHYRDMAFMGVINVITHLSKIASNLHAAYDFLDHERPDALILVDYPSFNLKVARYCKDRGLPTKVFYYISPKLWAWKSYRIRSIKRYVDAMLLILPFEQEYYRSRGYSPAYYVGNPLCDAIEQWRATGHGATFRQRHELDQRPIIALLPGSRTQEIKGCLPTMLNACRHLLDTHHVLIAGAPGQPGQLYQTLAPNCKVIFDDTYSLLDNALAAIVNSGTATLETALIGCPQVVVYNIALPHLASLVKPLIIKTKYVSLVNIVAGSQVVRELVAADFTTSNVRHEIDRLLTDDTYRSTVLNGYRQVRDLTGDSGGSQRAAKRILQLINHHA
ncbi:MAG TPA: lipid-A-disaccharide synthase [Bacteroidales bacterium]|nr:lipid-A-disaccharide synthase [Bacteroidales bacterium]